MFWRKNGSLLRYLGEEATRNSSQFYSGEGLMARLVQSLCILALAALAALGSRAPRAEAQGSDLASVKFTNLTGKTILVQGVSFVGGVLRKGQMIVVPAGKFAWDNNVPPGSRQYRMLDASSRVLNSGVTITV